MTLTASLPLQQTAAENKVHEERAGRRPEAKRTELRRRQHSVVFGLVALTAEWGATACRGSDTLLLLNEAITSEARLLPVQLRGWRRDVGGGHVSVEPSRCVYTRRVNDEHHIRLWDPLLGADGSRQESS